MSSSRKDLSTTISKLTLTSSNLSPTPKPKSTSKPAVADSWEEDASDSDSDNSTPSSSFTTGQSAQNRDYPDAPPPTPISPNTAYPSSSPFSSASTFPSSTFSTTYPFTDFAPTVADARTARGGAAEDRRPEKTDAVAKRMIAGALGVRAPKKTEEQKEYERAVREKERRRKEREGEERRREEEERERARKSVWSD